MCLFNKYQIFNLSHFNFPFEDSYSPESEQFTFVYIIVELPQVATKVILLQNTLQDSQYTSSSKVLPFYLGKCGPFTCSLYMVTFQVIAPHLPRQV